MQNDFLITIKLMQSDYREMSPDLACFVLNNISDNPAFAGPGGEFHLGQ
jgi:hypothetical protein